METIIAYKSDSGAVTGSKEKALELDFVYALKRLEGAFTLIERLKKGKFDETYKLLEQKMRDVRLAEVAYRRLVLFKNFDKGE